MVSSLFRRKETVLESEKEEFFQEQENEKNSTVKFENRPKALPDLESDVLDSDSLFKKELETFIRRSFLSEYLEDENLTDIRYNGTFLTLKYNNRPTERPSKQPTKEEVYKFGNKIADIMGEQFTPNNPTLNVALPNMRINFIHDALSTTGCVFSVRITKPVLKITSISEISNEEVEKLLKVLVKTEQSIIICGRTGAGKTELQKRLFKEIPDNLNVFLIEDTPDSHMKELYSHKDITSLRTLTEDTREKKIEMYDLMKEGLRNDPDFMSPAEIRDGREAYTLLESILTDHAAISTLHVKRAKRVPARIITMIGNYKNVNEILLGKEITSAIKFAVYLAYRRTSKGVERFIKEIVEFTDYTENGVEYITLYERKKEYDIKTKQYKETVKTNPLSEEIVEDILFKEYFHELPDVFIPDSFKGVDLSE